MKKYKTTFLIVVLFLSLSTFAQKKPNIIIIIADDLGWNDVGFHNPKMITPHLNEFAQKGIELKRFYVGSLCSPTRAGLLTGKYPDRFGLRNVVGPRAKGGLPVEEQTIANILTDAGYKQRGAFGKWHLGHSDIKYHPMRRGFTTFYGHYNGAIDYFSHYRNGALDWHDDFQVSRDSGYSMDLITQKAVQFINKSSGEPFFAYIALNAPHTPLQAKSEYLEKYGFNTTDSIANYDAGGYQKSEHNGPEYGIRGRGNTARQTYAAMVTSMDKAVGDIMQAVEKEGIAENTIIWFMSDNGGDIDFGASNFPLRGEKQTEWEGGVKVVSLVYWKGRWQGGKINNEVIGYIDVLPTLIALIDLKVQNKMDGIDVSKSFFTGKKMKDRIFFLGKEAVVSKEWKLNIGQLFKIEKDVSETTDVSSKFKNKLKKMEAALTEYKKIIQPIPLTFHPVDWKPETWDINKKNN